jgi:hypothetical protein
MCDANDCKISQGLRQMERVKLRLRFGCVHSLVYAVRRKAGIALTWATFMHDDELLHPIG